MNIYFAGYGHPFERTPFVKEMGQVKVLLSYYYLGVKKDQGMMNRFKWVEEMKNEDRP